MNKIKLTTITSLALTSIALAGEETVLQESQEISLWNTIASGGIIGFIIIAVSIVALTLIIDNMLRVRRSKMIPDELLLEIEKNIKGRQYEKTAEICRDTKTFLTDVIKAGLSQHESVLGYYDMQNSMQEESERYISKLLRRIDYLSFIGSVTPMLGLLGTVTGMIKAFNQIARKSVSISWRNF